MSPTRGNDLLLYFFKYVFLNIDILFFEFHVVIKGFDLFVFFFLLGFLPEIKGASFEWCSTGAVIDILCSFLLGIIVSL